MTNRLWILFLVLTMAQLLSGCTGGTDDDDSCFVAGTMIDTPNGPVQIEQLQVGQSVYAYDTEKDKLVESVVARVWVHHQKLFRTLLLPDGRTLGVTENHPVYSATQKRYVPAGTLGPGTSLIRMQGANAQASVALDVLPDGLSAAIGRATVYNIEVADYHNYFAEGVLVHNKSPDASPPLVDAATALDGHPAVDVGP